jgi:SnoaL-like protein
MGELEAVMRQMFEGLDKGDISFATTHIGADAQGIDEISRRWMRGSNEVNAYVQQLMGMVSDVHSDVQDGHEQIWGDVGLFTCWLEQDYTMEGNRQHVSAPTTAVLRRQGGAWKVELFHSLPLPAEP